MTVAPTFPPHWRPVAGSVMPGEGEVVLVAVDLDVAPVRLQAMRETFSPRERNRYESFAHEDHRRRWGAGRGTLREVLGAALDIAPTDVAFNYGGHGKPEVPGLKFNISHSGRLAVIALSRREVGVDVELPRPRRTDQIARRFYAPGENELLFALSDEQRVDAFFRLWTCKEAFLKVTGEGLSRSTRSYEIQLAPPRVLWATGIPDAAQRYSVHPMDVGDPYRGAFVAEGQGFAVRHLLWA
jgi:4'-phosphopantetheinyl transferase